MSEMNQPDARNWIDLGEWGKGMDEFRLPLSDELARKQFTLCLDAENQAIKYAFDDTDLLNWKIVAGSDKGQTGSEKYEAICVAPNIYFVDYVKRAQPDTSISIVLDLNLNKATLVRFTAPHKETTNFSFRDRLGKGVDLSIMKAEILSADINPGSSGKPTGPHQRTGDLIGKRIKYTYARDHVYEHIYLNDHLYTWHCLIGPEKGLGDTDSCSYYKISPDLYLFLWQEKIMPTCGLVIIGLKEMRSNGKTFGLDIPSGNFMNFTMGAIAELINDTKSH